MKATEQYFPVVLFIMLYKVVLAFESVDEILWCYHSNESYWAILTCGTLYSVFINGCSTFQFPRERYCLGLSYGFVKYFDKSWILYPTTKTFSYTCRLFHSSRILSHSCLTVRPWIWFDWPTARTWRRTRATVWPEISRLNRDTSCSWVTERLNNWRQFLSKIVGLYYHQTFRN